MKKKYKNEDKERDKEEKEDRALLINPFVHCFNDISHHIKTLVIKSMNHPIKLLATLLC